MPADKRGSDTVDLVVSLLVRHPEISRISLDPRHHSIRFSFILTGDLTTAELVRFRRTLADHVQAFYELERRGTPPIGVARRVESGVTFLVIERDTRTLTREEISLVVDVLDATFGERVLVNPPADVAHDDDPNTQEEVVGSALDALRRGRLRKSLIGFRDDRRVLIYFGRRAGADTSE